MFLSISPLERKTVPSFSQSSVPSLPASLAAVESKLSVPQSPPRSPVKSPLEVRLYPQPYFQTRTQHQAQQLKKIEPPLQSPVKLKPKVVSTALVRVIQQFPFPFSQEQWEGWEVRITEAQQWVFVLELSSSTCSTIHVEPIVHRPWAALKHVHIQSLPWNALWLISWVLLGFKASSFSCGQRRAR